MGLFREHFLFACSDNALCRIISEYQEKYTPKKGRRFNLNGITYELGESKVADGLFEFEISSKIPETEVGDSYPLDRYFADVKKILLKSKCKPSEVDMDEIIKKESENEIKTRDYVRTKFNFELTSLMDDEELVSLYKDIESGASPRKIPVLPGVSSPIGSLALSLFEEKVYNICLECMEDLIKANDEVRKNIK